MKKNKQDHQEVHELCKCHRCKLQDITNHDYVNSNAYKHYLSFAKMCIRYQSRSKIRPPPNIEYYQQKINNFNTQTDSIEQLDKIIDNYIKNYSKLVLKNTFDLGTKNCFYATHKKVEAILKEKNIIKYNVDLTKTKTMIDAYKKKKHTINISSNPKLNINWRYSNEATCRTHPSVETKQKKSRDQKLTMKKMKSSILQLKKRNLWKLMHISHVQSKEKNKNLPVPSMNFIK